MQTTTTPLDQPMAWKGCGSSREGVPRSPQKRRCATNSSANCKKRDPSPSKGRGPPGREEPPLPRLVDHRVVDLHQAREEPPLPPLVDHRVVDLQPWPISSFLRESSPGCDGWTC